MDLPSLSTNGLISAASLLDLRPLPSALDTLRPSADLRDLRRALDAARRASSHPSPSSVRDADAAVGSLRRSLGAALVSWEEEGQKGRRRRAELEGLYRAVAAARLEIPPRVIGGEVDWEDVVVRVKAGEGAVGDLGFLVEEGALAGESGRVAVATLLGRLAAGQTTEEGGRARILGLLTRLVLQGEANMDVIMELGALPVIVQSLANDIDEVREAIGLLLSLSDVLKFRQRLGRVPGCIKMVVSALHVDDAPTSHDAQKLLHALSGNIQNVLVMAEAGYFEFLFPHLREGSDMNKTIAASAIGKMDLSDQMKAHLGGAIKPLVEMLSSGKLEAKLSSLGALKNLSTLSQNVPLLIRSGIVTPLFQLLFSVTSVLITLREPAAAILACISQSELILQHKDVAQQMLSLLSLSNPTIQLHLLQALNSMASYSLSSRIRAKMKSGAIQLILPFLATDNNEIRLAALMLLYTITKDQVVDFAEKVGETHILVLTDIISTSESVEERSTAIGILSNIPVSDKKTTGILQRSNLLPVLSLLSVEIATPSGVAGDRLVETIAALLVWFTFHQTRNYRGFVPT